MTEKQIPQLRNDLERLRSSSPAIKRPASDMGAQDREEHTADVEMDRGSSPGLVPGTEEAQDGVAGSTPKAKQIDTGSRHLRSPSSEAIPHASNIKATSQALSEETSASRNSLKTQPSRASTTATSISSISMPSKDLPSIDEQVTMVMALANREVLDKQKGYIVSMTWLNRVRARSSVGAEGQNFDKSATEGEVGPVDNTDLAIFMEGSGELKDEAGEIFVSLRPGLQQQEDYYILPQDAWDLVVKWYGNGADSPIITRYAHNTSEGGNVQFELNPIIFSILKVPGAHTTETQNDANTPPPRFLASRATPAMEWLRKAKALANIDQKSKVRVWRYLGGLKGTSGSGMLTPAASRSASPAPGVEIVASAGDLMLLDVVAFANLSDGDQKELITDLQDQTANEKYNGKSTLQVVGIGKPTEVIILEEQTGGPAGGEWPSETSKGRLSANRGNATKKYASSTSGRSSPAPGGVMTRGRQRRDAGRKGITGLSNLGNTCYMNSALQCVRSVEELTQYFLQDKYKEDLNPSNPLSHNGHVAKAYADLLQKMYGDNITSFSPSNFKHTIGRYGPSFSGYGQQDSQEFLLFLLDGLAEDLSRIDKKPYIEKPDSTDEMVHDHAALKAFAEKNWEIYKARNDSVITDLFSGLYKSTVTCPVCHKVSIIFDPFNSLTLQLPIENNWSKEILFVPFQRKPVRIDIDIDKNASIKQLKEFVAQRTKTDPDLMVVAEAYKNRFYKMFDNNVIISEANFQPADVICVYELDSVPTNYNANRQKKYSSGLSFISNSRDPDDEAPAINDPKADRLLIPVFNCIPKTSGRVQRQFILNGGYIVLDREDQKDYDRILKKLLGNVVGQTTRDLFDDSTATASAATPEDSDTFITNDDGQSSDSNMVQAHSVESEDGIVDVSMKGDDGSLSEDKPRASPSPYPPLRPGGFTPPQLQNLFDIKVLSTGEAVPTGWTSIDEHKDFDSITDRLPRVVVHRPARSSLALDGGRSGSTSSDEDVADIPHDATEHNDADESDSSLPSVKDMFSQPTKPAKRKQMTYGKKDRRKTAGSMQSLEVQTLVRPGEAIILEWKRDVVDALFLGPASGDPMRGRDTWECAELFPDDELLAKRAKRTTRRKNGITLDDCLNETGKSETLSENNAWYCPRCKEHRRADKKLELWKIPDILVMHLKRFSSNRNFRDKLEIFVDYPVEGLDMKYRVIEPEEGKSMIYDLIAVDMHYGGLGGGHYTAYGKNFFNNSWYEYNDQSASARPDARAVVTSAAYLLFYRRRADHPLGGPVLEELLTTANAAAESEEQHGSRDTSPVSGEGRRLGDSSHNGSSSASIAAGQAHRVGDGGPATTKTKLSRGVLLEDGSPLKSVEGTNDEFERPPGYTVADSLGYSRNMADIDDEGIDTGDDPPQYGPAAPWHQQLQSSWGFGDVVGSRMMMGPSKVYAPPGSPAPVDEDEDLFDADGDGASTKVEGGEDSPRGSEVDWPASDVEDLMDTGDKRGARESAPPPDGMDFEEERKMIYIPPATTDEDEEDLPVAELHAPLGEA